MSLQPKPSCYHKDDSKKCDQSLTNVISAGAGCRTGNVPYLRCDLCLNMYHKYPICAVMHDCVIAA